MLNFILIYSALQNRTLTQYKKNTAKEVTFFIYSVSDQTSSFTVNREHRLDLSENKVLRKIYEPKRDDR